MRIATYVLATSALPAQPKDSIQLIAIKLLLYHPHMTQTVLAWMPKKRISFGGPLHPSQ